MPYNENAYQDMKKELSDWINYQELIGRRKNGNSSVVKIIDAISETSLDKSDQLKLFEFLRDASGYGLNLGEFEKRRDEMRDLFAGREGIDEHKSFIFKLLDQIVKLFSEKGVETTERKVVNKVYGFFDRNINRLTDENNRDREEVVVPEYDPVVEYYSSR